MKRVLLLGDSIRLSYQPAVTKLLEGRAEVVGPEENCMFAKFTLCHLASWLAEFGTPDIIHWNNGIWDAYVRYVEDGPFVPVDEYVRTLKSLLRELRKTGAQVIFATSTPCRDPRYGQDSKRTKWYNHEAVALMKQEGIPVDDLWSVVNADIPNFIDLDDNLHLTEAGVTACADAVVKAIEPYLSL